MLLCQYDHWIIATDSLADGQTELAAFVAATTVPTDYADITSLTNWKLYWNRILSIQAFREILIDDYISEWETLSDDDKKILIEFHVWPSGTPDAELDALYTDAQRESFADDIIVQHRQIGCVITKSTTASSKKYIKYTVDDTEVITTDTITSFEKIL